MEFIENILKLIESTLESLKERILLGLISTVLVGGLLLSVILEGRNTLFKFGFGGVLAFIILINIKYYFDLRI